MNAMLRLILFTALALPALLPGSALACGTYQTCNLIVITDARVTPNPVGVGEPVTITVESFQFANWASSVSTMTFVPYVMVTAGGQQYPAGLSDYRLDAVTTYGSIYTGYWHLQNSFFTHVLEWDGLDAQGQPVTGNQDIQVVISAGAASDGTTLSLQVEGVRDKELGSPCDPVGDPCNPVNGNVYKSETDYRSGDGRLRFVRSYNSLEEDDIGLGPGWRANVYRRLEIDGDDLTIRYADGRGEPARRVDGLWQTDPDSELRLEELSGGGYRLLFPDGRAEEYDAAGHLLRALDAAGNATTYDYDTDGRLVRVTGPYGKQLQLSYTPDGHVAEVVSPAGRVHAYEYDTEQRLSRVVYPDGASRRYLYDDPNRPYLSGIEDATGVRFVTYHYGTQGRVVETYFPETTNEAPQERYTFAYADDSVVVTDAAGNAETFQLAETLGQNNVTERIGADGAGAQREYDARNNVTRRTDAEGNATEYEYNATNQRTRVIEAAGTAHARERVIEYLSPQLALPSRVLEPSVVDGEQRVKTTEYDASNRPTRVTETGFRPNGSAISRQTQIQYDAHGRVVLVDGPRTDLDDTVHYTYHDCTTGAACGQRATRTNAMGHTTYFDTYDADGRLLVERAPSGLETHYTYDARGRLTVLERIAPGGQVRRNESRYDAAGRLIETRRSGGSTLTYSYDAAGDLRAITDELGNRLAYGYDSRGNRIARRIYDRSGSLVREVQYQFDLRNRLQGVDSGGILRTRELDASGRILSRTDAVGGETEYAYDPLGRVTIVTDPLAGTTTYDYDANGMTHQVEAPNGALTTYEHDDFGNRIIENSPDRGLTYGEYDAAGNMVRRTDARGVTATYTYDALGRVTAVTYPDPALDVAYQYDTGATGVGRLTAMTDRSGTTAYSYNAFGDVLEKTVTPADGGPSLTTAYEYTAAGAVARIVYPSGLAVCYDYDDQGQVLGVRLQGEQKEWTLISGVEHTPFGPARGWTYGNGIHSKRSFDLGGRPSGVQVDGVLEHRYTLDPVGNIAAVVDDLDPARDAAFTYDALDRLTQAQGFGYDQGFTYDANGNRLLLRRGADYETYTITPGSNRLVEITGARQETRQYDAAGNTLSSAAGAFTYDERGRLSWANGIEYRYNGKGERVSKRAGALTTHYHYDERGHLLAESTGAGAILVEYVYLGERPIAAYRPDRLTGGDAWAPGSGCRGTDAQLTGIIVPSGTEFTCKADSSITTSGRGFVVEPGGQSQLYAGQITLKPGFRAEAGGIFYAGPIPAEISPDNGIYYLHTDHLGTVRRVTSNGGDVIWRWDPDPFGEMAPRQDPDGDGRAFVFNLRFPGQYFDQETRLHYNYFRDYDPATGRYIESDPIGLDGGANTYAYASGNPQVQVDPYGLRDYVDLGEWNCLYADPMSCFAGHAYNELKGATEYTYQQACDGFVCVATCSFKVIVGTNGQEVAVNASKEYAMMRLRQTAKAVASKALSYAVAGAGWALAANDVANGITCTVDCMKE